MQIRDAFADMNVEPPSSVLHGRKGLTPTIYVAPFLAPYANALGQARTVSASNLASPGCHRCNYWTLTLGLAASSELESVLPQLQLSITPLQPACNTVARRPAVC